MRKGITCYLQGTCSVKKEGDKMKISETTGTLDVRLGVKKAIQLLKDAGFDCYDMGLYYIDVPEVRSLLESDNYIEVAQDLRRFADKIGITCNQVHAPTPSSKQDNQNEARFQKQVRSVEIAGILGAKIVVTHPLENHNYADCSQQQLFQLNVDFYKRLVRYGEKFGVKVAVENMCQCGNGVYAAGPACEKVEEIKALLDAVDSPWFAFCLDVGHMSLTGVEVSDSIRQLGNQYLHALHLHDTDLVEDSHTLPFTLKIDFEDIAKALGEIDYQGDLTFEALKFFRHFPDELLLPAAKLMSETGKYLAAKAEAAH